MRRITILFATLLPLVACDALDELVAAREKRFELPAFDRISLSGSHEMIVAVGGAPSVWAEGDPERLARLDVRVVDRELRVETPPGPGNSRVHGASDSVLIRVSVPALRAVRMRGAELIEARMIAEGVSGARFEASVTGNADLVLRAGRIGEASFTVRNESTIHATGEAERIFVLSTSRSDANFRDFRARYASVALQGSGNVAVHATGEADVALVGWGDVVVIGTRNCNTVHPGFGSIYCPERQDPPLPWYLKKAPAS